MRYPIEEFTEEERKLLVPHFTNLDRPVFALVNLPETIKGALFARYSRYAGTVRRLYLEEFAAEIKELIISGVELDAAYNRDLFPKGILGLNADYVNQYVQYVADLHFPYS